MRSTVGYRGATTTLLLIVVVADNGISRGTLQMNLQSTEWIKTTTAAGKKNLRSTVANSVSSAPKALNCELFQIVQGLDQRPSINAHQAIGYS